MDVLSACMQGDTASWYENDGGAPVGLAERVIDAHAPGARFLFPADFDGDGDVDVALALYTDDAVAWYERRV